jgi:hypothetical protein
MATDDLNDLFSNEASSNDPGEQNTFPWSALSNVSCNEPFAQAPLRSGGRSGDRRRERRAALDVFANRFLEGHPYLCHATDISRKGMRIRRLNEPSRCAGRFSGVQFQLPGCPDVFTASGEIVFEDPAARTLGIRFTHLSSAAAVAIDRFLQRCQQG